MTQEVNFPELVIAGLGRCGMTMTARMLDEGGLVVAGEPPGYEPNAPDVVGGAGAVRLVDPIGTGWTSALPDEGALRWVWLARDARQQAKSMAKMLEAQGKRVSASKLRKTIRPDTRKHFRYIDRRGEEVLKITYEDAVARTEQFVDRLAGFIPRDLNRKAMLQVVDDRGPKAAPDLSKELSQL